MAADVKPLGGPQGPGAITKGKLDFFCFFQIWYAKSFKTPGDPVKGVFDWPSYICIVGGFAGMLAMLWISYRSRPNKELSYIATYAIGHVFGQGLPEGLIRLQLGSSKSIVLFFVMTTFFLRLMYLSMVITKMTAKERAESIDSLDDLFKSGHSHRKIMINPGWYDVYSAMDSRMARLKDRQMDA